MKTVHLTFVIFLLSVLAASGQTDTINKRTVYGEKDGIWIEYLDTRWNEVNDPETARFYRYVFYDDGFLLSIPNKTLRIKCGYTLNRTGKPSDNSQGGPEALDGKFTLFNSDGFLVSVTTAVKGEIHMIKFYRKYTRNEDDGMLLLYLDFTRHYKNQPHTYYVEKYNRKGYQIFRGYFRRYTWTDKSTGRINSQWMVVKE